MAKLKARWTPSLEQENSALLDILYPKSKFMEPTDLKRIGYWRSIDGIDYTDCPIAEECIDESWDGMEKEAVINYLRLNHRCYASYMGYSQCRIYLCPKRNNGDSEFTDGEFLWPEGYLHYIVNHNVKPPQEFINKCLNYGK